MRLKRYMLCLKPAKQLVFHLLLCFYFMHLGAIYILCASMQLLFYALCAILHTLVRLLFYARQRNFMQGNFRHWQASTPIGVVLKRRADCELARKGCPVASTP